MEINKQLIEAFVEQFHQLFFKKQFDAIQTMLTDSISVGGIYVNEIIEGKDHVIDLWKVVLKSSDENSEVSQLEMDVKEIEVAQWNVESIFKVNSNIDQSDIAICFATKCNVIHCGDGFKIDHVIFSVVNEESVMKSSDIFKNFMLEREVAFENNDDLLNSVPCGIFKCIFNDQLSLIEVSDGFLRMIGYTRDELQNKFHNNLKELIVPEDYQHVFGEVREQLKHGLNNRLEYRLLHKNGNVIWVLEKGTLVKNEKGEDCFHCIAVDITVEKEIREQYEAALKRSQIIINQTNDVIFEWDIHKDKLFVSSNWEKNFGKQKWPEGSSLIEILANKESSPFCEEDYEIMQEAIQKVVNGEDYVELELRILRKDAVYIWCKIRVTVQKDSQGNSSKAIGVVIDIDEEKRRSISLQKKASQDALTGISNKASTRELIVEELKQQDNSLGALLIVDIDDFKCVNDTRGHLFGDAVLKDIANTIKDSCRSSDILGRIGGDEFMVFLKDIKQVKIAKEKAQTIIDNINAMKSLQGLPKHVSCSIGISLYPDHGDDFNSLYKYADFALYQAKTQGKNGFSVYDEKNIQDYIKRQMQPYSSLVNADIDSNIEETFSGELAEYVFNILYESDDTQRAIEDIMNIIGEKYDVSRVYIFENSVDDKYCQNTFEWCNEGVVPQKHVLQEISYEVDLGNNYLDNFNENGIFYCADIATLNQSQYNVLEPQGIKSLLQCAIRDNGKFRGFVGFDECDDQRYWTQEQIRSLSLIAEILSIFLLKSRKEEMYEEENKALLSMLDNQDSFIYVVEEETFKILYANKKTEALSKSSCENECCYKLFVNRDTPCEICPAKLATRTQASSAIEFFNQHFNVWSDAYGSYIQWKGKHARLIVCHDITRFKK